METALEYIVGKNRELADNYREDCILNALEIAKRLLEEGKRPHIMVIRGGTDEQGIRRSLIPKLYNGRIFWEGHMVCCEDGLVYDSLFDRPIPVDEYPNLTFEGNIEMEILFDKKETKRNVKKGATVFKSRYFVWIWTSNHDSRKRHGTGLG